MARKWHLFYSQISLVLKLVKYLVLGLLLVVFTQFKVLASPEQAAILTQEGFQYLDQGQTVAALETWQKAYKAYQNIGNQEGMKGSLINQSLALQADGSYLEACYLIVEALVLNKDICFPPDRPLNHLPQLNSQVEIIGLLNLGNVLQQIGSLQAATTALQQAEKISLGDEIFNSYLLLSLANTERLFYEQAKNQYLLTSDPSTQKRALLTAKSKIESALKLYQEANSFKAKINQLGFLVELRSEPWLNFQSEVNLRDLVKQILAQPQFDQLPIIDSIYAKLNLAQSLVRLSLSQYPEALNLGQEALSASVKINNQRAKSAALGLIGSAYNQLNQTAQAQRYFEQAVAISQSIQAWDLAYQWQWKLGQLYSELPNSNRSLEAYTAAINSLDQIREDILAVNPELQFAFKEKVEPVYLEYIELLISQEHPDLKRAVEVHDKLRIAELENYLQCNHLNKDSLYEENAENLPTIIHLIKLKNKLEIIVRNIQGFHQYSLNWSEVEAAINNLLILTQDLNFINIQEPDFIDYSQAVYNLIITPIKSKSYLPNSGTLIFIVDSYLQNIPFSMLHDGEKYLVESYSISTSISSTLIKPKTLNLATRKFKTLIGGISQVDPNFLKGFAPLPQVTDEIKSIQENMLFTSKLINNQFTSENFLHEIETHPFQIVHLSTHAQYSSDPENTFILSWDKLLKLKELKTLFQNEISPIELLILSACQTAKGDKQATLGIAGLAVQGGARSTLASLWLIDSNSTGKFMDEFYKSFTQGNTKAQALRQAQLKLLHDKYYSHPYFWSAFILVGSWS